MCSAGASRPRFSRIFTVGTVTPRSRAISPEGVALVVVEVKDCPLGLRQGGHVVQQAQLLRRDGGGGGLQRQLGPVGSLPGVPTLVQGHPEQPSPLVVRRGKDRRPVQPLAEHLLQDILRIRRVLHLDQAESVQGRPIGPVYLLKELLRFGHWPHLLLL